MKKIFVLIILILSFVLIFSASFAEVYDTDEVTEILLPHGTHAIYAPNELRESYIDEDLPDEVGHYLWEDSLEIVIFTYNDMEVPLSDLAVELAKKGNEVQIREISGTEFLVYNYIDDWDGATCVGYTYNEEDGWTVEISFFCGTQEAMELTVEMMESFH